MVIRLNEFDILYKKFEKTLGILEDNKIQLSKVRRELTDISQYEDVANNILINERELEEKILTIKKFMSVVKKTSEIYVQGDKRITSFAEGENYSEKPDFKSLSYINDCTDVSWSLK